MNDYASSSNTDSSESHRAPRPSSMDVPSPSSVWAFQPSSADAPHPEETQWRERWFHAFDTECFVKARATEHNLDQVVSLCARYERLLSHTLPGSDIWAVNHAEGRRTKVDPETAALVREALRYCSKSSGLFDLSLIHILFCRDAGRLHRNRGFEHRARTFRNLRASLRNARLGKRRFPCGVPRAHRRLEAAYEGGAALPFVLSLIHIFQPNLRRRSFRASFP